MRLREGPGPKKPYVERVTKMDAVRRQLRTAVRMFFEDRDTIATYTVAAAVEGLLGGLLKHAGKAHPFRDSDIIVPEHKKEFFRLLNRPQNFFKHSDDDPEGVLEFAPVSLEYVPFECAVLYHLYAGRPLREAWIFTFWFSVEHPNLVKPGLFNEAIGKLNTEAPGAARRNKKFFLELMNRADIGLNAD
jgi:hypothetical protein